jgi:hypothetical protein
VTARTVRKAVAERVSGSKPGALRAFIVAVIVGFAAAVITYRLLRSGG